MKIENGKRCDNCIFSFWIVGLGRPMLVCKQKTNFVGKYRSLPLAGSCANFYPTTNFKLSLPVPRRIPLTRGKFAIVDADDYYRLAKFTWHANEQAQNIFYAAGSRNGKGLKMHRVIMNAPDHLFVDHIDRNGLNNCRSNLRLCTPAQNNCNVVSGRGTTSKYKGVCWDKRGKNWRAVIQSNKKTYHLGTFADEIAAARAYDEKAKVLHREFACLNFPTSVIPAKTGNQNCRVGHAHAE